MVVMAVVGSILLDRYGARALQNIHAVVDSSGGCKKSQKEEARGQKEPGREKKTGGHVLDLGFGMRFFF